MHRQAEIWYTYRQEGIYGKQKPGTFISEIIFQLFRSSDTDRRSADLIFGFLQQNPHAGDKSGLCRQAVREAVLEVSRVSSDADYLHRAIYQNSSELEDLLNYFRYDTEEYLNVIWTRTRPPTHWTTRIFTVMWKMRIPRIRISKR